MDGKRFDQITTFLAGRASRRKAVKVLAGTIGGVAVVRATNAGAAAQDAPGEEWVAFYEEMAAVVEAVTGDCGQVSTALREFQEQNADRIARMQSEIASWSSDQAAAHRQAYGARVQQAAIKLHLASTRCGYLPGSDSSHCIADVEAQFGEPQPAPGVGTPATGGAGVRAMPLAQDESCWPGRDEHRYCDCACSNDFTTGNCVAWAFACGLGGCAAGAACCWSGICVAGFNHDQCVNQCVNCTGIGTHC